jgi:guanine deaminase
VEKIIRGSLLDFVDEPGPGRFGAELEPEAGEGGLGTDYWVRHHPDGALVVSGDGYVRDVGDFTDLRRRNPDLPCEDHSGMLVLPGFVDTHVHYPQTQIIGSYGKQLLEWLRDYTFPVEERFDSADYAGAVAADFLDELLRNGTTTCVTFAARSRVSVDALFTAASRRRMRIIAGQVLMGRNAAGARGVPGGTGDVGGREDVVAAGYADGLALIKGWHRNGRNLYAVTPRFAISCGAEELAMAGRLHAEHPDTYVHTHLAESEDEVRATLELFPDCADYVQVYERAGMVTDRSVFAHGIHLSGSELDRLGAAGAVIAHCPTSNLYLGSGLYSLARANRHGVTTTVGTDVGAGTSFSMLRTLNEAYKVQQLQRYVLSPFESFHRITRGAARALHLADLVGGFGIGAEADLVVLDPEVLPLQRTRAEYLRSAGRWTLANQLFGLLVTGDDRNVRATYVMGERVHGEAGPRTPSGWGPSTPR